MQKQVQEKIDAILHLQIELIECKSRIEHLTKEEGEIIEMTEIKIEIILTAMCKRLVCVEWSCEGIGREQ